MLRPSLLLCLLLLCAASLAAPARQTENVILVTYDGLRWQEVFSGADPLLIENKTDGGVQDTNALKATFWRDTPEARREILLPFLWNVIAKNGQIFGNRPKGSTARVTNGLKFSYPGYNELLTGSSDPRVDSNNKIPNPNVTVLEWLNQKPAYRNRVAAFCSWDVFPYIINRDRSGVFVRAGREPMSTGRPNERKRLLDELIRDTDPPWDSVVNDSLMFHSAHEYFRDHKPRVLYLAFDETDDWAHDKRYDRYLQAARRIDRFVATIWTTAQSLRQYRGKTTLVITTDHGRGDAPVEWRNHGKDTKDAEFIWMAFLGPDTPARGERTHTAELTQGQIAATVAALLGEDYHQAVPKSAPPITDVLSASPQLKRR